MPASDNHGNVCRRLLYLQQHAVRLCSDQLTYIVVLRDKHAQSDYAPIDSLTSLYFATSTGTRSDRLTYVVILRDKHAQSDYALID